MIELGVRNTENAPHIPGDFYAPWAAIVLKAFSEAPSDFGHATLHADIVRQARKSLKYWDAFQPSADSMMVDRAIGGHYWTLKQLGVNAAFRDALEKTLNMPRAA